MSFETVIGLEVHVQLGLRTKLFSRAPLKFGAPANSCVAVQDMATPGTLPMLNAAAIGLAVRAALACEGQVQSCTRFARKNYFYPDLPKGYQISQYDEPYCLGGRVPLGDGRYCELTRIHLEEDAGKSSHGESGTQVDLNRAGIALIEIVSKPVLHSPVDAHAYLQQLKQLLQYAEVSDCDMEQGSLRCDANISLRPAGTTTLGTKVEIKNLNSFKMVQRALEYEERRQAAVLATGGQVRQETRLWNDEQGETASMRSKESAQDYRYFPDPDLPPLWITAEFLEQVRAAMPELPAARRARWVQQYALPTYDLDLLTQTRAVADYFEALAKLSGDAKTASNWVMTEVLRVAPNPTRLQEFAVTPPRLAELLAAVRNGLVNLPAAKKVFGHMFATGVDAATAIRELGLEQISDDSALEGVVRQVLADNAQAFEQWRAGKDKAYHALKGLVMRASRGKANPSTIDALLRRLAGEL